ncbi:hypothetical protein, partial [Atlantibacter sp.]|uniref:hypothetical protein n=1 Tax=Atlantibacter sp. TaxID=1903473 RepID=UPI0028AF6081
MPITACAIAAQDAQSASTTTTLQSLDSITAQSSGIPELLLVKPIPLPEPNVTHPAKPKKTNRAIAATQTDKKSSEPGQVQNLRFSWAKEKAELENKLNEARKLAADYQKQLTDVTNQKTTNASNFADLQQQLAEREDELEALKAQSQANLSAEGNKKQLTFQLQKSLEASQKQAATYQKQLAALTDEQAAKAKALTELQQQLAERDKTLQEL